MTVFRSGRRELRRPRITRHITDCRDVPDQLIRRGVHVLLALSETDALGIGTTAATATATVAEDVLVPLEYLWIVGHPVRVEIEPLDLVFDERGEQFGERGVEPTVVVFADLVGEPPVPAPEMVLEERLLSIDDDGHAPVVVLRPEVRLAGTELADELREEADVVPTVVRPGRDGEVERLVEPPSIGEPAEAPERRYRRLGRPRERLRGTPRRIRTAR